MSCFDLFSIQLLKKHTLNPEITILYQFHAQKALFKVLKICNKVFWIENDLGIQSSSSEEINQNLFTEQESPQLPALVNNDVLKNVSRVLFVIPPSYH